MKRNLFFGIAVLLVVGCNNEKGVPGRDDRVITGQGSKGATPNQEFTVTNSSQQTSVPREGGNLDRGVTRGNDPANNAPGPDGKALNQSGTGTGPSSK
jgi:hypothetical protein